MTKKLKFFIDFDGTVTRQDVIDAILERFADPSWRTIETEWAEGRIGSRECLTRQIEQVGADLGSVERLIDSVEVDADFFRFVKRLGVLGIPAYIVSDGMDLAIHRILKRVFAEDPELRFGIPVFSNRLEEAPEGRFKLSFPQGEPCVHGCANCKERLLKSLAGADEKIVFIGDGLSDRYAAQTADLTFAKGKLLSFCKEKDLNFLPYDSFKDIIHWINELMSTGDAEVESQRRQDPSTMSS